MNNCIKTISKQKKKLVSFYAQKLFNSYDYNSAISKTFAENYKTLISLFVCRQK